MTTEPMVALIDKIRSRPALFLEYHSITQLKYFLAGYGYAGIETNRASRINEPLGYFGKFVANYYGETKSIGWDEILLSAAGSETAAYDLFWQHWDAFMAEQRRSNG